MKYGAKDNEIADRLRASRPKLKAKRHKQTKRKDSALDLEHKGNLAHLRSIAKGE